MKVGKVGGTRVEREAMLVEFAFTSPIRFSSCAASGSFFAIACYVSNACDVAGRFYD